MPDLHAQEAMRIGGLVRQLRKDRGWSQHMLALRSGLSVQAISNTERGYSLPKQTVVQKLVMAFAIDPEVLGIARGARSHISRREIYMRVKVSGKFYGQEVKILRSDATPRGPWYRLAVTWDGIPRPSWFMVYELEKVE